MNRFSRRVVARTLCFMLEIFYISIETYIYFLNPARRRRDGVKEDYYV